MIKPRASGGEWIDPRSACILCKPDLEVHTGPGIPVYTPGVVHRADCELVPRWTAEQRAEYNAWLAEWRAAQRRAWEKAHTYVIGGR